MNDKAVQSSSRRQRRQVEASNDIASLEDLLDRIQSLADCKECVSVRDMLRLSGRRWYGPLLVVAGLVMMMPVVSDIPGVPVLTGAAVILISVQLLMKQNRVWLPLWLQRREVSSDKVGKAIEWARPTAAFVDRYTGDRLRWLVKSAGLMLIALMSIVVAAVTPLLELIPFSATLAGMAIAALGVSVLATDGALALLAIALCVLTVLAGGSLAF